MGAEVKRKEDPRLITGTSTYVGDLALPGMHYVAFVRSPHAHARVRKIDAGRGAQVARASSRGHRPRHPQALRAAADRRGRRRRRHRRLAVRPQTLSVVARPCPARRRSGRRRHRRRRKKSRSTAPPMSSSTGSRCPPWRTCSPHGQGRAAAPRRRTGQHRASDADQVRRSGRGVRQSQRVAKQRMVSQRLCGVPLEGRAPGSPPPTLRAGCRLGDEPGAARLAQRPGDRARHAAEPDSRDRAGVGGGFG